MRHSLKATALLWLLLAAPAAAAPTVTEFNIPTAASQPQDIVLGPDGKLWFTENSVNKIGRVTPGNPPLIEEFPVAATFTEPLNITVGPDGKIWFSGKNNGGGGVGRMNPANLARFALDRIRQDDSLGALPPGFRRCRFERHGD